MPNKQASLHFAVQLAAAIVLLVCLWRIEAVNNTLNHGTHEKSGQSIASSGVSTERWIGETLEAWRDRHLEAVDMSSGLNEGDR